MSLLSTLTLTLLANAALAQEPCHDPPPAVSDLQALIQAGPPAGTETIGADELQRRLEQRKTELDEMIRELTRGRFSSDTLKRLDAWQDSLTHDLSSFSGGDAAKMGGGAVVGMGAKATVTGSIGLSGTGIGLVVALYTQMVGDALHDAVGMYKAVVNTAFHWHLREILKTGRTPEVDDKVETFLDAYPGLLRRVTGERPPRRHKESFLGIDFLNRDDYDHDEVNAYLKRHALTLFTFIGVLEEEKGPAAFPRYKRWPGDEVGAYREVVAPHILKELKKVREELEALSRPAPAPDPFADWPKPTQVP